MNKKTDQRQYEASYREREDDAVYPKYLVDRVSPYSLPPKSKTEKNNIALIIATTIVTVTVVFGIALLAFFAGKNSEKTTKNNETEVVVTGTAQEQSGTGASIQGKVVNEQPPQEPVQSKPVNEPVIQNPQSFGTMYVTARDFLALKNGPGINYQRIYKIPPREAVTLLENMSGEFVKVSYNGMVGYVAARYLSSSKPVNNAGNTIMYVTARDFLALKNGPGINYQRIYKIPPREAVTLLENISGEFVKVSYNGMVGYVAARYLSSSKPVNNAGNTIMYANVGDFLALKSGRGINYERILKIPPGGAVTLLESISSEFVKVSYNGTVGYVAAKYLSATRP